MQNLEWYLADLKSTGKNTIETVEKSLTDMFIRLVRIYPCLFTIYNKLNILQTRFLRYIVGFGFVEMAISTNPKPTIYRNLYENTTRWSVGKPFHNLGAVFLHK